MVWDSDSAASGRRCYVQDSRCPSLPQSTHLRSIRSETSEQREGSGSYTNTENMAAPQPHLFNTLSAPGGCTMQISKHLLNTMLCKCQPLSSQTTKPSPCISPSSTQLTCPG